MREGPKCSVCEAQRKPGARQPAAVPRDLPPLHTVALDLKSLPGWIGGPVSVKAVNMVCEASELQRMGPFFEAERAGLVRHPQTTTSSNMAAFTNNAPTRNVS